MGKFQPGQHVVVYVTEEGWVPGIIVGHVSMLSAQGIIEGVEAHIPTLCPVNLRVKGFNFSYQEVRTTEEHARATLLQ